MPEPIVVAYAGNDQISILPKLANRHGLIAGATGTGKTVTLQSLAQSFSQIGVPSFLADVKGDLAGMSQPGGNNTRVCDRLTQFEKLGMSKQPFAACPVTFWDVYGEQGHPVRTTVDDMGPLLLARLFESQRNSGRRADHRISRGKRPIKATRRLQRPAFDHPGIGRRGETTNDGIRKYFAFKHWRNPTSIARPRTAGRRQVLRRASTRSKRLH